MWDVDVDIMKRMVEHKLNGHNFRFASFNMTKNINQNFKEIMHMIVKHDFNSNWFKLSVQDVHPNVLAAVDRPGDWAASKQAGLELLQTYADSKKLLIVVEIILGLPEQTVESFTATLSEVYKSGFATRTYPFLLLRNAPATYDLDYRAKHGIKDALVYELLDMQPDGNNVKELIERPLSNFIYNQIVECNTFTQKDFVKMSMIDQLYRKLFDINKCGHKFIDVNWEYLEPVAKMLIQSSDFEYVLESRYPNFKQHGINAMDSSQGEILLDGIDLAAVIGRNLANCYKIMSETNADRKIILKALVHWQDYKKYSHMIDR
jgi:hypothetical protein